MSQPQIEEELRARLEAVELRVRNACDLIPVQNWGFDESIRSRLEQRKFSIVGQNISKDDKKKMSKKRKHKLAKQLGAVPSTVSQVLDWINTQPGLKNVEVKAPQLKPAAKITVNPGKKNGNSQPAKKTDSSSSEEDDEDDAKEEKPSLAQPIVEETSSDEEESDESSDNEEESSKAKQTISKKRKNSGVSEALESKRPKNQEPDALPNPIDSRQTAIEKLKNKLESFKAQRRGKKSAEDFEQARKLKRRMSKLKLKQKRVEEKKAPEKTEPKVDPHVKNEQNAKAALKSEEAVVNGITYSKFDFIVRDEKKALTKQEKRDKFSGKDYKRLIEKAERRKEKIESIRTKNPEKAEYIEESIKWNKVLQQAEGQKVRDNVDMLKRAAKRKEKTKERSKKKWDNRQKTVEEKQAKRQEKRVSNIDKRKEEIKKRKMDKLRKKGRIL